MTPQQAGTKRVMASAPALKDPVFKQRKPWLPPCLENWRAKPNKRSMRADALFFLGKVRARASPMGVILNLHTSSVKWELQKHSKVFWWFWPPGPLGITKFEKKRTCQGQRLGLGWLLQNLVATFWKGTIWNWYVLCLCFLRHIFLHSQTPSFPCQSHQSLNNVSFFMLVKIS